VAKVALIDAFNQVRVEVHGCPSDLIKQALRETLRDFCKISRAFQDSGSDTIQEDVRDYEVVMPESDVELVSVESLRVDGVPSNFKTLDWLDTYVSNWRDRDSDDFTMFTHLKKGWITFPGYPTLDGTAEGVQYRMSMRPTKDADDINEEFADEWKEEIEAGAKARLMFLVNKTWSNPQRAQLLSSEYARGRARARVRTLRSLGNAQDKWVGPRFAGR